MRKFLLYRLLFAFLLAIILQCSSQNTKVVKKPFQLTVEGIRNTNGVGIIDAQPEYGWAVPMEVKIQRAYQILVASSKDNLDKNVGDVWDSGLQKSNTSTLVEHQGGTLEEQTDYYWKVRVWGDGEEPTAFSDHQHFTISSSDKFVSTGNSMVTDTVFPVDSKKLGETYFLDFGKAAFGTLVFSYEAPKDHELVFHLGEQLGNGRLNRKPAKLSNIRYQQIKIQVRAGKHSYRLALVPDERNTQPGKALPLPYDFPVIMPFRYVELEGLQGSFEEKNFKQLAFHGYWEEESSDFSSSNAILDQVWELCKYSIKATTFNGLYVDGDRERIPYEADAYLNQLSHYGVDNEYAMARRTMEYFMENPTWPTEWQQHVALMFHADYMYTGNTELIEMFYEPLKVKTLIELSREDGLISSTNSNPEFVKKLGFKDPNAELRDITDWPPANWGGDPNVTGERDGFVFQPYNTVINAFFYENMKIMGEFARILGKMEDAKLFEQKREMVKKSINEKLFDVQKGYYVDGEGTDHASLHANMMPLAFGIVPEEHKASVIDFIKSRGMACSVYGAQYLMDGLYEAGEADYALQLLTDTSDRSWYNMIRIGSTITLEAWDMRYKPNADWNHAWGAVPANIIPRRLWGIRPKTPGFGVATIAPQMSQLNASSIKVPTVKGTIEAAYQVGAEGTKTYEINIPGNTEAEFHFLEDNEIKEIKHNNELLAATTKTVSLSSGKHIIVVSF